MHSLRLRAISRGLPTRNFARLQSTLRLPPTIAQLFARPVPAPVGGASTSEVDTSVTVQGWVKSVRRQKKYAFAVVADGTTDAGLQAVMSDPTMADQLTNGASVRLKGKLVASPGSGQDRELQVDSVELVGASDAETYPIQKKELSVEYLRTMPHLRPRRYPTVIRERDRIMRGFHDFYATNGFVHVNAPILTTNDCEAGGETFLAIPSTAFKHGSDKRIDPAEFFGHEAHLSVSGQLHLEAVASSFPRTYTLGPCFRAEQSATGRHLTEFWMLEAEVAFENELDGVMDVLEQSVKAVVASNVFEAGTTPAADATASSPMELSATTSPWSRITYTEALERIRSASTNGTPFEHGVPTWGQALRSEHERYLAQAGPIFVTHYPRTLKPFYMRVSSPPSEHGETVDCFDLLVPRVGELAGGSMREHRLERLELPPLAPLPEYLRVKLKSEGKDAEAEEQEDMLKWYADLRRWGTTPHGGFGLGFERLVAWSLGLDSVREAIPFPRWYGKWGM